MEARPTFANGKNKQSAIWREQVVLAVQTFKMYACMDGYGQTKSMQLALTS